MEKSSKTLNNNKKECKITINCYTVIPDKKRQDVNLCANRWSQEDLQ